MTSILLPAFILLLSFLLGSIPIRFLIAKAKGMDIRKFGSGNVGATNINRTLGKKAGVLTLIGDLLKGSLSVLLAGNILVSSPHLVPWAGFFAILGHCFSPFLQWKGGKGVATSLGVFLVLSPVHTLISVVVFILVLWLSKYVSLASVAGAISMPLSTVLYPSFFLPGVSIVAGLAACLICYRHKANLLRLRAGSEPKFGLSVKC